MVFFDFFNKNQSNLNSDSKNSTQTNATSSSSFSSFTTSTSKKTSYSGIGSPPGNSVAYSGIGQPPLTQPSLINQNPQSPSFQQTNPLKNQTPFSSNSLQTLNNKHQELDLLTHLTPRSNRVFVAALSKAKELQNQYIDSEHLLYGLLTDSEIYRLLVELKVSPQLVDEELKKNYKKENFTSSPTPSPRVKKILNDALILARKLGFEFISPEHILLSLYEEGEGVAARVLNKFGLKREDLNKKILGKKEGLEKEENISKKKSALEQFTIDLTAKAAQGLLDPVVERSEVIERVIHILCRRTKNNPALIGEAGVGKTAIVEGLAQKIVKKEVPEPLLNKKILQLDLMAIIAGASHRGEFEERMKNLIEEVKNSQGEIILFIDEIHNLVGAGAGGEGSLDASNFLKPSLARGELQLIGATTISEYRRYIEKDPALERRFQTVVVPEPTEEQAIKMLKAIRDKYEAFHRVKIPDEAIETAVRLSKRYIGDRFLPDKAVDLIDEAASAVRLPLISLPEEIRSLEERIKQWQQEVKEAEKTGNRIKRNILLKKIEEAEINLKEKQEEYKNKKAQTTTYVTPEIIKDIISRWTGIPVSKITESEVERLAKLEEIMHQRLINQERAVSAVAEAIRRGRAGLKSTKRPIGSFIFLGPTGVGKTELAKTLAEVLFGQEEAMIRFDMTEYMEKHEVAKLLGAPPGYVGYEEGGKLTEAVRRKPYSVVLFDEVEKAHPDIFNILLQILDDGRLTDNKGRTISFKNTVIICTSNIGTSLIQQEILKSGKIEIEEPPMISTYVFSPRGREILTIGNKIFEKEPPFDGQPSKWQSKTLFEYFEGQKIESEDNNQDALDFPVDGFNTHAISPKGIEIITKKNNLYYRTSTTSKIWKVINLIDYFKESVVINAIPDAPEQQLPTGKIKTHAFSPDEWEIITYKDRFWRRKAGSNDWETGNLKDYFANCNLLIDEPKENKKETIFFPITYWDIHTFSPSGKEIIIVGDKVFLRNTNEKTWRMTSLKTYFGDDFPLEKEIEEKRKVEEEAEKNQYQKIKEKVMNELLKFFRPELVNRFDEVIIFEPLRYPHMVKIAELQLKGVGKLLEEQNIGFKWTEAAVKEIVRNGFDPIFGARPLRRAIQKLIENPISSLIIEKKVKENDQIIVDFDGENFVFNIEKVELVPENLTTSQLIKQFFCEKCGNSFKTLIVKNSTPICPKCASKEVQEELEHKEEKLPAIMTP